MRSENILTNFFFSFGMYKSFRESQYGGCTDSKNPLAFYNSFESPGHSRVKCRALGSQGGHRKVFRNELIGGRSSDTQGSALFIFL